MVVMVGGSKHQLGICLVGSVGENPRCLLQLHGPVQGSSLRRMGLVLG